MATQPIIARESLAADFFDGIPSCFALEDRDGNILSKDVKKYGFEQGDAWVAYFLESEMNMVAASTSWYASTGTSDDRMTLPAWKVKKGDVIQWRARSFDKYIPNSYKVIASCEGKEDLLFFSNGETYEWTFRQLSLDSYVGKEISLSFVDCSTDASLLFIDDIRVGTAEKVRGDLSVPAFVTCSQPFEITGGLTTDIEDNIEGELTVKTRFADDEQILDMGAVNLHKGETLPFRMSAPALAGKAGENQTLHYEVSLNGEKVYEGEKLITPIVNYAVCEELTGTWCAWCVRGIASFKKLSFLYPDSFIGIAIHNGDIMSEGVKDYEANIYSYGRATGYPFAYMMRSSAYTSDFDTYEDFVGRINAMPVTALVKTEVGEISGNTYPLSTVVTLTKNMTDDRYQLAYVLVENDVYDPTQPASYIQKNAYAGGEMGECDGFENLPEVITEMHFDHVARAYVGDYNGISASLPIYMKQDVGYVSENTIELPETVLSTDNCEVVTLLIDTRNSTITAADKTPLNGSLLSIDETGTATDVAIDGLSLLLPDGCNAVVSDITGGVILTTHNKDVIDISRFEKGIYVVTVSTAKGISSMKFTR